MQESINIGLEGVVVGATRISNVEGESGQLSYRGVDIDTLSTWPFAKVAWWVLFGEQETNNWQELEPLLIRLGKLDASEINLLKALPRDLHPMLMLQSVIPALNFTAIDSGLPGGDKQSDAGLIIAAKIPQLIAAWHQLKRQGEISLPDDSEISQTSLHENFLQAFNGHKPSENAVRTLEITQILQMEHSFNAGTFAGRVVASTQAPIQSVISASMGALFGRLHGGADQAALEMAMEIASPEAAASYVTDCLASGKKIMGMGHREYRVVDPRAKVIKGLAENICTTPETQTLFQVLTRVEEACQHEMEKKNKQIWANVEFYKGAVFKALGVEPEFFTALFAMARVYGYLAHYLEFQQAPRLIRPKAHYAGE